MIVPRTCPFAALGDDSSIEWIPPTRPPADQTSDEKGNLERRLAELTKRVQYIEERLSIVRREAADESSC